MKLPPELAEVYPAMRLVTAGLIKYGDLQTMTLDEIDDINVTLAYEEQARERLRRRLTPPKDG